MTINRTNTASTVEAMVAGFDEVRADVAALTDVVEFLVVTLKKNLGADAGRLLEDLDAIRQSPETQIIPEQVPSVSVNEIGAVYSPPIDSAAAR